MSRQPTLWATPSAISSPASAAGPSRSDSPAGETTGKSGPAPAPASRSRAAGKARARKTRGTSGLVRHLIFRGPSSSRFGEQVASKDGREWLAGVRANLETLAYVVGAADLCAAGVAAPHIRQRLFWVADAGHGCRDAERTTGEGVEAAERRESGIDADRRRGSRAGRRRRAGHETRAGDSSRTRRGAAKTRTGGAVPQRMQARLAGWATPVSRDLEGHAGHGDRLDEPGRMLRNAVAGQTGGAGFWSDFDLIPCRDGKARRVEPGTFPLAHGVPARVGRLRGYGNAIVPQVAAEFRSTRRTPARPESPPRSERSTRPSGVRASQTPRGSSNGQRRMRDLCRARM
jgi:DNA (cytosine-5)-methyltransferase 1